MSPDEQGLDHEALRALSRRWRQDQKINDVLGWLSLVVIVVGLAAVAFLECR